jgi:hypothetical protein
MKIVRPPRYGSTIYCDDLRDEVGNKQSYMGIYSSALILSAAPPVVLPRLVIIVKYNEPMSEPWMPLRVNVYLPDAEEGADPTFTSELGAAPDAMAALIRPDVPMEEQGRHMIFPIIFTPLPITTFGRIRVRLIRGDEEFRLGSLEIIPADASLLSIAGNVSPSPST